MDIKLPKRKLKPARTCAKSLFAKMKDFWCFPDKCVTLHHTSLQNCSQTAHNVSADIFKSRPVIYCQSQNTNFITHWVNTQLLCHAESALCFNACIHKCIETHGIYKLPFQGELLDQITVHKLNLFNSIKTNLPIELNIWELHLRSTDISYVSQ